MEVHASCRLDYKTYKELNKEHFRITWIAMGVMAVWVILLTAIEWLGYAAAEDLGITNPLISTFALALMAFLLIYFALIAPRNTYRSSKAANDCDYFFTFRQDGMSVVARSNLVDSSTNVKYEAIFRVIETSKYFFIYISNSQAYIVDKSTVCDGTDGDIRNTLLAALGSKKYKLRLKAAK